MHDENTDKLLSDILTAEILEEINVAMSFKIQKQGIAGPFSLGMKLYPNATMQELEDKGFY